MISRQTHTQSPHSRLTSGEGLDPPGFDANQLRGMSDVDGYSAEWPNKNARVNARHAVTPLEGMPVIWLAGGEERVRSLVSAAHTWKHTLAIIPHS